MEKKETMEKVQALKKRFNYRQLFMILVLVFSIAADILLDYVNAGFNAAIFNDASYWIMLGLTCLSVVLVTLAVRDFFREKELRENSAITETQKLIDKAHADLLKYNLTTRFEDYVNNINAARKLKAYREYLQFRLSKTKNEKKREKLQARLNRAGDDIEFLPTHGNKIKLSPFVRVKYAKVRISTIFSRTEKSGGEDEDIEANEQRHISELIFKKLFSLVAFSIAFSTLFFESGTFAVAILVNTFMKLFRTAMSILLGASDGQSFARGTLLSKMKLRLDFIQKFLENEKKKGNNALPEEIKAAE